MKSAYSPKAEPANLLCPCCGAPIVDYWQVVIDPDSGLLVAGNQIAELTAKEMQLFQTLWQKRAHTLSRETLLESLYWQGSIDEEPVIKIIDVFICKMRKKLAGMPLIIETVWGRGYRIKLIEGAYVYE